MSNLLFFDIDGTLYRHQTGMPESTREAIRRTREKGNHVMLCTGRGASTIPEDVQELRAEGGIFGCGTYVTVDAGTTQAPGPGGLSLVTPAVLSNPAAPMIGNRVLTDAAVEGPDCQRILEILKDYDCPSFVENPDYFYYDPEFLPDGFAEMIDRMKERYLDCYKAMEHGNVPRIAKMTGYPRTRRVLPELIRALEPWFTVITHEEYDYVEITLKGYTKGTGVEQIARKLGVDREHIYGFGDSGNDVPMLDAVGHPVVMGDAPDELKSRYIATANMWDDGLALAMEHLNLI